MVALRSLLEQVTSFIDSDPALKGGLAIGGTVLGLSALAFSWLRRSRAPTRNRVSIDVPDGTQLDLKIGRGKENTESV